MDTQQPVVKRGKGRPKGSKLSRTVIAEELRLRLQSKVADNWEEILNTTVMLAKGDFYYECRMPNTDEVKIYKAKPDPKCIELLMNHAIGKPKESIEMNSPEANQQIHDLTSLVRKLLLPKRMKHDKTT